LYDELPAATSVTGSPNSIMVKWLGAVSTRTTLVRSGFSVSIRWALAVRAMAIMKTMVFRMPKFALILALLQKVRRRHGLQCAQESREPNRPRPESRHPHLACTEITRIYFRLESCKGQADDFGNTRRQAGPTPFATRYQRRVSVNLRPNSPTCAWLKCEETSRLFQLAKSPWEICEARENREKSPPIVIVCALGVR
jgi:hypothetical protein